MPREFAREPLLTAEQEAKLKALIEPMWAAKMTGSQIARVLKFGIAGEEWEEVKPAYFYYYRRKLKLPLHGMPRFKKKDSNFRSTRYKKLPDELGLMSREMFIAVLNKKLPNVNNANVRSKRSFLIALYKTGLRASELYMRKISDFTLTDSNIIVHLLRLKKLDPDRKDEPAVIKRSSALEEEIVSWLQDSAWRRKVPARDKYNKLIRTAKRRKKWVMNERPWNVGRTTVQRWVTEVFEDTYAHYYRYNVITLMSKLPGVRTSDLKSTMFLTMRALENYIITPEGTAEELNRLREEHEGDLDKLVAQQRQAKTRMK